MLTQQHLSRITSLKVGGLNHPSILNGLHAIIGTQLNILKIETVHFDVTIEAQGNSITKVFFFLVTYLPGQFPVFGEQRQAPVSVPGTQGIVVAKLIKETDASFHIQQAGRPQQFSAKQLQQLQGRLAHRPAPHQQQAFSPGPPQAHPAAGPPLRPPVSSSRASPQRPPAITAHTTMQ